jgi:hypothetical protein
VDVARIVGAVVVGAERGPFVYIAVVCTNGCHESVTVTLPLFANATLAASAYWLLFDTTTRSIGDVRQPAFIGSGTFVVWLETTLPHGV